MFVVIAAVAVVVLAPLAAWLSAYASHCRERRLREARLRRRRAAWEFEACTGRYAYRPVPSPRFIDAPRRPARESEEVTA